MIDFVKGKIDELTPATAVIECAGGVGYALNISLNTYSAIQDKQEVKLYVYEAIREDAWVLFGFASKAERELFLLLLTVSGVGGNTARMVLSSFSVSELAAIITENNDRLLATVKGLGKKTTEQMVLTLKDRAATMLQALGNVEGSGVTGMGVLTGAKMEAVLALHTLGVKDPAAEKAVAKAYENLGDSADAAALIPEALKYL